MIPQEPDIKARQRAASLEVPEPPDPISPNPLVFRQHMAQAVGVLLIGSASVSAAAGFLFAMILNQGGPLPFTPMSYSVGVFVAIGVFFPLSIQVIRKNKTQARVEVVGSTIRQFGQKGELFIEDDLRNIENLLERHAYRGPCRYYVFFKDGKILAFNSELDQEFRLRKILQNWGGKKFEEVDMYAPNPVLDQVDRR